MSMRCCGGFVLVLALMPTVINPVLNYLIVPMEKVNSPAKDTSPYVAGQTDVVDYSRLPFVDPSMTMTELWMGPEYIMLQSMPKWLTTLFTKSSTNMKNNTTYPNVTIRDARNASGLEFSNTGFTLYKLPRGSATTNWRSQDDIKKFHEEMEIPIRELFPDLKRIEWTHSVVRGGDKFGDQPAAVNGPHLDYSQNDTARREFHDTYSAFEGAKEQHMLLGKDDLGEKEGKLGVLLGIWKPIHPSKVCDHPLAVMDARTYHPEHERPYQLHIDFLAFTFHNLNGAIVHDAEQQWWYYSFQTTEEVLIFTQYTRGKHFANPHTSFENPNCPPESVFPRQSVELRAGIFF